jgi:hypothetical protein
MNAFDMAGYDFFRTLASAIYVMDKVLQEQVQRVPFSESAKSPPPGFPRLCVPISSSSTDEENVPPSCESPTTAMVAVGPGGDCPALPNGDGSGEKKLFKKKTRGTRGGRKNRIKKEMVRKRQFLATAATPAPLQKRTGSYKKIVYSVEELVKIRTLPGSQGPPRGIVRIERKSSTAKAVEIFPVSYLPDENSVKKGELSDILISKKIDEICDRIIKMDPNDQIQGIEPHFLRVKKGKSSDLDSSACSSMAQNSPRDSGVASSESGMASSGDSVRTPDVSPRDLSLFSPRESESVAEINTANLPERKPDVPPKQADKPETELDSAIIEEQKFKMRPPKPNDPRASFKSPYYETPQQSEYGTVEYMMPLILPTWPNPYYGSYAYDSNAYGELETVESPSRFVPVCPYIPYPTFYPYQYIPYSPVSPTSGQSNLSRRSSLSTLSSGRLISSSSSSSQLTV